MAKLRQSIGKKTLLMLTVNSILGTGIYFLPAVGAAYSGSSSILSWAAMSLVAIIISLYFAELISMFPKSGGVYEFVKNAFGRQTSFVFGWMSWIISNITISMLIVGSVLYIMPGADMLLSVSLALLFILFFNIVSYRGIDWASRMLLFFGVMTVGTLVALIVPGLFTVQTANFAFIFSAPTLMILLTIYFISETFFGWETTTYLSEEVRNAQKIMPRMLVLGTVIIAAISMLLVFVALGNIDAGLFSTQSAPLAFLAGRLFGGGFDRIFSIIVFIPLIGTAASWIVSSPRLLFAMSRDRMLVPRFARIHRKYRTPHNAIFFQTVVTALLTIMAFGSYMFLLSLLVPLVIIMYSIVMLSVVRLRIKRPDARRYFSAPLPKIGPVAVVIFNLMLLAMWLVEVNNAFHIFMTGLILILTGYPLYIIVRLQNDKKFTEKFYDRIAPFWDRSFRIWYGDEDAKRVVKHLRLRGRPNVLDFGCGSGNTTMALARVAGNVVAVDLSEKQMQNAINKLKKRDIPNVIFVKGDRKFPRRSFDAVTAIGVLEFLDNPKNYVGQMIDALKPGGRFYFMSFGKSLGIPAPGFLEEENIRKLFRGRNVSFRTKRTRKLFTEYVHIYGTKLSDRKR